MATNMARKRFKKAQRRKQVVAEKRRAEALDAGLPARVLRAAQAPIQYCFLSEAVFETGMGTLVLALRDLAAWSRSIGFAPRRDFAVVERIFGDVSADASDAAFRFGHDGKPVYIPGPSDSAPLIQRRIQHLQKHLGDDNIGF